MFFKTEIHLGFCGMDTVEYIQAGSLKEAAVIARDLALNHAESYGFEQNEEMFGDYDTIGRNFDEDEQEYDEVGFLDYSVDKISEEEYKENILQRFGAIFV